MTDEDRKRVGQMGFDVTEYWSKKDHISDTIACNVCEMEWSFPAEKAMRPGGVLHLLNHKRGHEA